MLRQLSSLVAANVARHITLTARCAAPAATASIDATTRTLSTRRSPSSSASVAVSNHEHVENTFLVETQNGRTFRLLDTRKYPPIKPGLANHRLSQQKTFIGTSKNIRHSPWRLNLICQMISGLPVPEALKQLEFSDKSRASLVQDVVQKTINRAAIKEGLQPTQLEVAECFATKGTPLKRIKPMARGRHGKVTRPHAHMRLVIREIDFPLRIYQQRSKYQKLKWLNLQLEAEEDAQVAKTKRDELAEVKARQQEIKDKEAEAESK